MELIDVYDRNGNRTGKVVERGTSLLEGEYILAVGMWIVDSQNRIFLTKRSSEKHFAPNKWENPAGHVQAGESCMDAVLREVREETGLRIAPKQTTLLGASRDAPYLGRDYGVRMNFDLNVIRLQPGETCDAKWVDFDGFKRMIEAGDLAPSVLGHLRSGYQENFLKFIGQAADALPEKG